MNQRLLNIYTIVITALLAIVTLTGAMSDPARHARFDEIDVERINVREPDGTLRMVLSNHVRLPGVIVKGKERAPEDRPQAGMIFYNDEGTENGGLIFGGRKNGKGQVVDAGGSLSFDKYGANQIVQLIGVDDAENRFAGLAVTDSPTGTDVRRRIWLGRRDDGAATLALMDGAGKKRILLQVGEDGAAKIAFLDANGKVISEITPPQASK